MKSTILNIKKRVLVVELPRFSDYEVFKQGIYFQLENGDRDFIGGRFKLICKGSELSEEIAQDLVPLKSLNEESEYCGYPIYTRENGIVNKAKFSFISAIEANHMFWGNPLGSSRPMWGDIGFSKDKAGKWDKAESKTLHPEQCLIFEIL